MEASDFNLTVSVLNVGTPIRLWRSDFKSAYLEDICRKTGQSKTYLEFNQMLQSALSSSTNDTFIDLLNLSDLQLLKGQKRSEVPEDPRSP